MNSVGVGSYSLRSGPVTAAERGAGRPRLDTVLSARPTRDAWFALEVTGRARLPAPFPDDLPYALTNAIDVDVDGDGRWTPPGN